jgi:hypothetical protein
MRSRLSRFVERWQSAPWAGFLGRFRCGGGSAPAHPPFERTPIGRMVFEALEPRLLLSDTPLTPPVFGAEINYDATISLGGLNATLEVIDDGGPVLRLRDAILGELDREVLNQNIRVNITGSVFSDTLTLDLGYDGTPGFAPFSIMVDLDGGENVPVLSDDTFRVQNSGANRYTPESLFLKSTSDITFDSSVTVNSGLDVQSEELIELTTGVNIVADSVYFGASKTTDSGFDLVGGVNILADATAAITVNGASITA